MSTNYDAAVRSGAYANLIGAAFMIIGAVLKGVSGVDLDSALATGDISGFLNQIAEVRYIIVANLSFWIVGVFLMGVAGRAMVKLCEKKRATAGIAELCYITAVPLAIASFVAWLAIVVQLSPEASLAEITTIEVVGWFVSRADWIATVLIVGAAPTLISFAGREDWVPTWLTRFGILPAIAGILTVIAMFTDELTSYGYLIVPVGLIWVISAGVVLFRRISWEKT